MQTENHENKAIVPQVWNDASTVPDAPGLYMRDHARTFISPNPEPLPLFCRWDGEKWFGGYVTQRPARLTKHPACARLQNLPWRELVAADLTPDIFEVMA
jgi:hypothetical protein